MKFFLMIGQSNMAGRGKLADVAPISNDKIFKLVNGRFIKMWEPINQDRSFAGVSLAASFAEAFVNYFDEPVGLVPCADGGTGIAQWQEGEILFDNAVHHARLAQRSGQLAGILWHQGENDCMDDLHTSYAERLSRMVAALYKQLSVTDIPFIAGELGDFDYNGSMEMKNNHYKINEILHAFAQTDTRYRLASAQGLTSNVNDGLHFDAASLREFGKRYFNAYLG